MCESTNEKGEIVMSYHSQEEPWIQANPGDLITAAFVNEIQQYAKADDKKVAAELQGKVEQVEDKLDEVDAAKFGGKTPEEWAEEFASKEHEHEGLAVYRQYFKVLRPNELVVLEHQLGRMPLVDIYQLDRFDVYCEEETTVESVTFYLYHSSEWRQRAGGASSEQLEPRERPRGIPFADMLARFEVPYGDESSLVDVETEFWKAFFDEPNDRFEFYCHSPWFEEHCREERRVGFLDRRGDWDELRFQMRPRKTMEQLPAINVYQLNFDTLGLESTAELEVMVLLKI
jgi:hypothetical protein